jgi:hypothetical protein
MAQPVPWLPQHPQHFPLLMSPAEKRRMPSNNLVPNLLCRETGSTMVNFNLVTNNEGPTLVSAGVSSSEASFRFQAKQTQSQQSYCWVPGQCQHRKTHLFWFCLQSGFFPSGNTRVDCLKQPTVMGLIAGPFLPAPAVQTWCSLYLGFFSILSAFLC